jgi:3-deoxy-7-phosphoheptulonate synthase / chorismate mutase
MRSGPLPSQQPLQEKHLSELRERIDALNEQILTLVQHRAEVVVEIARLKQELGLEGHDPQREEAMLRRLTAAAAGPFGPAEVRSVFRAIFRASLALQNRLALAPASQK